MGERRQVTVRQCACGYAGCRTYWLVGLGQWYQGAGFMKPQAERIAELVNADPKFPLD